jgi:erythromycin esterase-like protein
MGRRDRWGKPETRTSPGLVEAVGARAQPLAGPADLDRLLERVGDARFVLLGEASHGTHEYYTWRAEISKRLVREKGFSFIAVEGDWPDCYRVNRYVKGRPKSGVAARDVLHAYARWPTWMWANEEVAEFADWLREHNDGRPEGEKVGFYGLDVYSLWDSLYQVMSYLSRTDGKALESARRAVRCFEPYGEDEQEYARATRWIPEPCEDEVVELLRRVREQAPAYRQDGREAHFAAEQNALVLKNAEAYYRAMVRSGPDSWNVRDRHMAETLGQLARERYGEADVVLVGFGSYRGSVIAAEEWDAPWERMRVPPGRPGSWEAALHEAGADDKLLIFRGQLEKGPLLERRGHRAIGVVYHPEWEHLGNYVPTVLPRRYDAFLYIDETRALSPLHVPVREEGEVPETYPTGV